MTNQKKQASERSRIALRIPVPHTLEKIIVTSRVQLGTGTDDESDRLCSLHVMGRALAIVTACSSQPNNALMRLELIS